VDVALTTVDVDLILVEVETGALLVVIVVEILLVVTVASVLEVLFNEVEVTGIDFEVAVDGGRAPAGEP